jgi:hypothetical protein
MNKCDPCQKHLLVARLKSLRDCAHGVPVRSPSLGFRGACAFADRVPVLERRLAAATADRDLYQIGADIRDLEQQAKNIPVRYAAIECKQFIDPYGICLDDTNAYIVDGVAKTITIYSRTTGRRIDAWELRRYIYEPTRQWWDLDIYNSELFSPALDNSGIDVYSLSGACLRQLAGIHPHLIDYVAALKVTSGYIYGVESAYICKRSIVDGAQISTWAGVSLGGLVSGTIFNGGYSYSTEKTDGAIYKSSVGTWVLLCGGVIGDGDGEFSFAGTTGIDITGGHIYVADGYNDRVQIINQADGAFIDKWGSTGSANGQFRRPRGLRIYGSEVFVVDSGNKRVQVFDLNGSFIRKWPTYK